jgi:hypothetical protein
MKTLRRWSDKRYTVLFEEKTDEESVAKAT